MHALIQGNQMIDAWFKYSAGHFEAEVNGQTITLNIPGRGKLNRETTTVAWIWHVHSFIYVVGMECYCRENEMF